MIILMVYGMEGKIIKVTKATHKKLYQLKIDLEASSLDDTVNYLMRFAPHR